MTLQRLSTAIALILVAVLIYILAFGAREIGAVELIAACGMALLIGLWFGRGMHADHASDPHRNPATPRKLHPDTMMTEQSAALSQSDSEQLLWEVRNELLNGSKIGAIKIYRDRTRAGLKEAKEAVEKIEREGL